MPVCRQRQARAKVGEKDIIDGNSKMPICRQRQARASGVILDCLLLEITSYYSTNLTSLTDIMDDGIESYFCGRTFCL